ncbi:M23 family metallopeptidase [Chitinispirillales bacterium ANBcel5]|uniref:M23 family metallopeptidase n=1 Tax=Cellulosispirillum alkaliphilum TaxID=3039283 RepID=UPI002A5232FC|nr:M23 family metallopeptidase [Chitinispirillales bacterium ANBcel5]
MSKKRTILFVPSQGKSIKAFRVRLPVAILLICIITIGISGFFIPFNQFSYSAAEQNEKKNLKEQNEHLFQNIVSTVKLLHNLRDQVNSLDHMKGEMAEISEFPEELSAIRRGEHFLNPADMSSGVLLVYLSEREKFIRQFASLFSESDNVFEEIPVIKPVGTNTVVTRMYGVARDPFSSEKKMHYGIDFAGEIGTPVISTADGVVSRIENDPIWGRRIIINHGRNFRTVYAHLGSVTVGRGRRVKRGDQIGTIGLSGLTTGPHVHYEVWRNNRPVDPEDYFFPQLKTASAAQLNHESTED